MDHRLEGPGGYPPLGLLADGLPRREVVVRQHPPRRRGPHDPAQRVEDPARVVGALGGVLADERQVRGDEGPLLVGNVGGVRLSVRHAGMLPLPASRVHNTL